MSEQQPDHVHASTEPSVEQGTSLTELDALPTDELRAMALEKADRESDRGFVWDLVKHMRGAQAIAREDGSSGAITGTIAEAVRIVQELRGKQPLLEDEPLLRARFLDYLRDSGTARDSRADSAT